MELPMLDTDRAARVAPPATFLAGREVGLIPAALCAGIAAGQAVHGVVHSGGLVGGPWWYVAVLLWGLAARRPGTLSAGRERLLLLASFGAAFALVAGPH
jgi:hypothetical protein